MTITLSQIWRHPIKAHGVEQLEQVTLTEGKTLPWDRVWAVAHEGAKADGTAWAPCANFSRGAKAPQLMAVTAKLDEATEQITLSHPSQPTVTLHPEKDSDALVAWSNAILPQNRAQSARVIRVPDVGITDTPFPSISIANLATNSALGGKLGIQLSPARWRANLWLDGLPAWEEAEFVGKTLAIGDVRLEVREQITRCLATTVSPETGERDADTLGALDDLGHQEFGVYAVVTRGGEIRLGDTVQVL